MIAPVSSGERRTGIVSGTIKGPERPMISRREGRGARTAMDRDASHKGKERGNEAVIGAGPFGALILCIMLTAVVVLMMP